MCMFADAPGSAVEYDYDYDYDYSDVAFDMRPDQLLAEDGGGPAVATTQPAHPQPEVTTPLPQPQYPPVAYSDLAMAVEVQSLEGVLRAELTWESVAVSGTTHLYTVTWGRSSCRVQDVLPECLLHQDSYMSLLEDDVA